jgi:hypothetical protein
MYRIKLYFAGVCCALLINGCGTYSGIGWHNGSLYFQLDKKVTQLKGMPVAQKRTNFKSLFLNQTVLQTKRGSLLVYEDAETDLEYEFEPTMMRIINVIFETRKKILLYARGNLQAYQVILPNGQLLNLIAQQSTTQELKLLYGMSTPELNRILKELDPAAPTARYSKVVTFSDPKDAIMTKWDDMKVHFYPLVVPLPRLMMGF